MIYQRGTRGSYDRWAEEVGDSSYRWDNILQYFDNSVDVTPYNNSFRAANASVNTQEYSLAAELKSGGPLQVSWPNFAMPFSSWGIQGLFSSGVPRLSGFFSSGDLHGAAYNVSIHVKRIGSADVVAHQTFNAAVHDRPQVSDSVFFRV